MGSQQMLLGAGAKADPVYIDDFFNTYAYEGNGSTQTITTGLDMAGEGGMVWFKTREDAVSNRPHLFDSIRGTNSLGTPTTGQEDDQGAGCYSFSSTGLNLGNNSSINGSGVDMLSMSFRKAKKFFDVVQYTGNATDRNISHGLGMEPGIIIVKRTDNSSDWTIYHRELHGGGGSGGTAYHSHLHFATATENGSYRLWGSGSGEDHTASTFFISSHNTINTNNATYIAYLFAHHSSGSGKFGENGDQDVISCGKYTGNGSDDGPTITLGFEPELLLIKNLDNANSNWYLGTTQDGMNMGQPSRYHNPNLETYGQTAYQHIRVMADGFKIRYNDSGNGMINGNGNEHIYLAISGANGQTGRQSLTGTDNFLAAGGNSSAGPTHDCNFKVGMAWRSTGNGWAMCTRKTMQERIWMYGSGVRGDNNDYIVDYGRGFGGGGAGSGVTALMFKRGQGLDVQTYLGAGTPANGQTVKHNLGRAPEMIWVKDREDNGNSWIAGHKYEWGKHGWLNEVDSWNQWATTGYWSAGTTSFKVIGMNDKRGFESGHQYYAILFASVEGLSKVGAFTGNNNTSDWQSVTTGFTPRLVVIKKYNSSDDWFMWDHHSGVSYFGNDTRHRLNESYSPYSNDNNMRFDSNGFTTNKNSQNDVYLYYAHA